MVKAKALPEVRQCQDEEDSLFGCAAVKGRGNQTGQWGVMNPATGGHWATDDEVKEWKVLA